MTVLICLGIAGHVALSDDSSEWRSLKQALTRTLPLAVAGGPAPDTVAHASHYWRTLVFAIGFEVLLSLLFLNIIITILMTSYTAARKEEEQRQEYFRTHLITPLWT